MTGDERTTAHHLEARLHMLRLSRHVLMNLLVQTHKESEARLQALQQRQSRRRGSACRADEARAAWRLRTGIDPDSPLST